MQVTGEVKGASHISFTSIGRRTVAQHCHSAGHGGGEGRQALVLTQHRSLLLWISTKRNATPIMVQVTGEVKDAKRRLDKRSTEYDAARLKHLGHR